MKFDELVEVLQRTNQLHNDQASDELLRKIVALVVRNPLEEDRAQCQEQIAVIISQAVGDTKDAH
jgi:hypothetical protein